MLTWFDYALFVVTLSVSFLIGVYFGCFGTKQSTTNEYLSGNKKMRFLPVGISVGVSHFSAIAILAYPADVYRYGTPSILIAISGIILACLSIYIYLPVWFKLQLHTVYDYLEKRFDRRTKKLAVFLYILTEMLYFPILVYAPLLTFATASGYSVTWIAFVISAVCFLYTSIGGFKTVIWTDIIQFVVILTCVGLVFVVGLNATGGIEKVWNTALKGERIDVFNFDMTQRDSFWTIVLGMTIEMTMNVVVHQTGVQKYLSLSKFQDGVKSVIWSTISKFVVLELCAFIGFVIYAKYSDCDPLTAQKITKHDQLVPYFIMDVAGYIPGIQGLFLSAIFSAALSSMSSLLNSLSGVIYNEFFKTCFVNHSEKTKSNVLKLIVGTTGILGTCLVFAVPHLGELLSITSAFKASTGGPLLGIFTLGMLFPFANSQGAFYGALGGMVLSFSLILPAKYYTVKKMLVYPTKPLSIDGCLNNISTTILNDFKRNGNVTKLNVNQIPGVFKVSFYYYSLIGSLATMVLGVTISCLTKKNDPLVDKRLINPYFHFLLPKSFQKLTGKDLGFSEDGVKAEE